MAEYGFLLAGIAMIASVAVNAFGLRVDTLYQTVLALFP
jgi:hypothetical protein